MKEQERMTQPRPVEGHPAQRVPRFLVQWWPTSNKPVARRRAPRMVALPPKEPIVVGSRHMAWAAATAGIVAGGLTLAGWWSGGPPWSTTVGEPPMLPFTAVCVMLLGVFLSGRLAAGRWHRVVHFGALTLSTMQALLLVMYTVPGGLATLHTMFDAPMPSWQVVLSVGLAAGALAATPRKVAWLRGYEWFAIAGAGVAGMALLGRLFGIGVLYQTLPLYTAPGHAMVLLLALNLGILLARPRDGVMRVLTSDTPGGMVLRRLLVTFVVFPVVWGWMVLAAERLGLLDAASGTALTVVGVIVGAHFLLWRNANALNRASSLRAEAEQQRRQFELLVRNTSEYAIVMLDTSGRIVSWNEGAERIEGYEEEEVLGKHFSCFYPDEDVALGRPTMALRGAAREGHSREEGWRVRKDGTRFWAEAGVTAIRDDEGRLLGYSNIVRDLSERKEAEAHRQLVEAMRHAETLKDQFLSILSHELRTPINAITGFGSILEDELAGPLSDQQHRYVRKMLGGADILLGLVNDLLDMSRIQAGRFSLNAQPIRFQDVVAEVAEHLAPLAEQKHDQLLIEVPQDLPEIQADAQRVGQILTNLVNNAIKFTPEGGKIAVTARIEGDRLLCEITDTGIGISEEDLPKLFQRFSQVDTGNRRRVGGTGLGLSISKALVEAHGGEIGVRSQVNVGSTFWFALPINGPPPGTEAPKL